MNAHSQPLISVIMPCYNAERSLLCSVRSVLEQSYQNLELIIINDGSTDNSLALLEQIDDSRLVVINQKNAGVSAARNRGLSISAGEMIAFLDADDTWDAHCLFKLEQMLSKTKGAALVYCGWQNIGLPGGQGEPFIPPDYEQPNKGELLFINCRWPIHATLTWKSFILEAGCFDESLSTSEDFLLWLKIGVHHKISLVAEVLSYYHHYSAAQATDNKESVAINHWLAQKKFLESEPQFETLHGSRTIKKLMHGELLRKGMDCYWKRDLKSARTIFKTVMKTGYGSFKKWKYMLPSLLPYNLHHKLISFSES